MKASESRVVSMVRLRAAALGRRLWRNNVGQLLDANGRPVRYGLANESKALNARLKSGDLIGFETITITPDMVGQRVARFLSVECKAEGWKYNPKDEHEAAQMRWANMVNEAGGRAIFATGPENL
jgi:hypothetical protein